MSLCIAADICPTPKHITWRLMLRRENIITVHFLFSSLSSFCHRGTTIMNTLLLWCIQIVFWIYWFWSLLTVLQPPSYYYCVDTYNFILHETFDSVAFLRTHDTSFLWLIYTETSVHRVEIPLAWPSIPKYWVQKFNFRDYFKQTRVTNYVWKDASDFSVCGGFNTSKIQVTNVVQIGWVTEKLLKVIKELLDGWERKIILRPQNRSLSHS